jgi:hypothetical protein
VLLRRAQHRVNAGSTGRAKERRLLTHVVVLGEVGAGDDADNGLRGKEEGRRERVSTRMRARLARPCRPPRVRAKDGAGRLSTHAKEEDGEAAAAGHGW